MLFSSSSCADCRWAAAVFSAAAVTEAPIGQIIRGSLPFVVLMLLGLALVMVFPGLALWLPGTMLDLGP